MEIERAEQSSDRTPDRGMKAVCWMTLAWAILLAILCLHKNWRFVYDDAYITMRYARHLAEGHGPRWNLSGAPVEGFSSPLHMLLLAAMGMARIPLVAAARLVGFASHAALVLFLWRFMARRDGYVAAALVSALAISSWPMLVWELGGLESTLFATTLAMGTLVSLEYIETGQRQEIVAGGALLGLAALVRPEGALVAAVALLACMALGQAVTLRSRVADVALAAATCALVALPWEIFRLAYYHAALPNTYYAKIYGIPLDWRVTSGFAYWRLYARNAPNLALMVLMGGISVLVKRRGTRFDAGLWACMTAYGIYILDSGGDHMMAFRFMVPLVPLMAVALVRGIGRLGGLKTVGRAAAISLLLALASARQVRSGTLNPGHQDTSVLIGEQVDDYINHHWASGSLVAVNVAGATAYYADDFNFIDMLGLNDTIIARRNPVPMDLPTGKLIGHLKGDGASVLVRRPQYIIPRGENGPALRQDTPVFLLGDYELANSREFWKNYQACEVGLPLSGDVNEQLSPSLLRLSPNHLEFIYYQRRDVQNSCTAPI
jgi:hypothetical protein